MRDGIEIEQFGIPAAVICTRPFIPTARAMAATCNLPEYPFAVVEHPVGSLTPEQLRARAEAVLPRVVELLSSSGPER